MTAPIHLPNYFRRIGYQGEAKPTLETLRELHLRHAVSIPFENLNPLLRWPVRLDGPALERKLVGEGRGGYCFEQNILFEDVLKALGFRVAGLSAGVVWNLPEGEMTARTHMLLRVDLPEGTYVADVGFGGQTMTGPLRLEPETEQATPHEPYRLWPVEGPAGPEYVLQTRIREEWRSLYRFGLQEQRLIDYEVGNWYVSTHPNSLFVNRLMAARPTPTGRYALLNGHLAIHTLGGPSERRVLASGGELREVLVDLMQIRLPETPDLDGLLDRLVAASD